MWNAELQGEVVLLRDAYADIPHSALRIPHYRSRYEVAMAPPSPSATPPSTSLT